MEDDHVKTQMHKGRRRPCDDGDRDERGSIFKLRNLKFCQQIPEARRNEDSPPQVSEEAWPWGHLDFRLLSSRTMRK